MVCLLDRGRRAGHDRMGRDHRPCFKPVGRPGRRSSGDGAAPVMIVLSRRTSEKRRRLAHEAEIANAKLLDKSDGDSIR